MDIKILISLIFVAVALVGIFAVKTRTSTISVLIIVHLLLIFFLSLTITNYGSFKEIILTIISYLMLVLFLITNYDVAKNSDEDKVSRAFSGKVLWYIKILVGVGCFLIFSASLYVTNIVFDKMKFERNNPQSQLESGLQPVLENAENKKIMRLQKKLSENFLFKRSSDIVLIIVFASLVLLVMQRKENKKNL
jgi:Ca2+/Na+ antiporter